VAKREVVQVVAEKTGMSFKDAKAVVDAFLDALVDNLLKEGRVSIRGLGTFRVKEGKERFGVNPLTKERIKIPARKRVSFRPSSVLKKRVQG